MGSIKYGKIETEYLTNKSEKLGKIIKEFGTIKRETNPHLFESLISSIVSQQISTKAATTVYNNLKEFLGEISPEYINSAQSDDLQKCGLSFRKVSYIKNIAESFLNQPLLYKKLHTKSDSEIIDILTKLKGVGIWTAQMLLIHTFERKDVISFLDLGIKKGLMHLYELEKLTKDDEAYFTELFSPYGTVASIYLWHYYANIKP